ncbi:MAG TPA: hypothetical protein VFY10_03855 [Dehalococcoidia bacterium]|nr:hypothetical protein [Dehalococcoidia bacterium]
MGDETEALITQIGLLLTQTRIARRALEDIERATSQYANFAFSSVIGAGKSFGDPPMVDGALKVHIVNIADLAPGSGFGALIEGLLGGAGRLIGNIFGGAIGGTIGSLKLLDSLPVLNSIAGRVISILQMLGVSSNEEKTADKRGESSGGSNIVAKLDSISRAVNGLTGLFIAASGKPEQAAKVSDLPSTPAGERWQRMLDSASVVLSGISRVVEGLIIALPIAIGSISWLIYRLTDIRRAIAETLQFLLRNALLLRGALTVTLFDTLALIARVAARTIELLADTLSGMLSAVFDTIRESLLAVLELGAVLGDAIKSTIDALLAWIVPTIDTVLRNFGNLRVFRVLTHVIQILPAILPPIYELKTDNAMPEDQAKALDKAAKIPFLDVIPGPAGAGATATIPPAVPDIRSILTDPAMVARLTTALDRVEAVTGMGLDAVKETGTKGLKDLGTELAKAAVAESKLSDSDLSKRLGEVSNNSKSLADQLIVPENVKPETGLEAIATAYESWLSDKNGLDSMLGNITRYFNTPEGSSGVPQKIVEGTMDRPRATIQIDEVVIEVEMPPDQALPTEEGPGDYPLPPEGDDVERFARMLWDYGRRGGDLLPMPV